jgi:MFS family permease
VARSRQGGDWSGLRKPLFWVLLAAFLAPGLFGGGYLFHLVTLLRERGFDAGQAAQVQSLVGLAVLVGRLSSGAAMDRFFAPHVAIVAFLISAGGCLLLLTDAAVPVCAAALGIGLTVGAELDIMAYTISRYFGVQSFGRLYGLSYGALIISSGFSPMLITLVAGKGGYPLALIVSAVGTSAGALILAFMPRYPTDRNDAIPVARPAGPQIIQASNESST